MKKVWYVAVCAKHGIREKGMKETFVKVPTPKSRNHRLTGGCPYCKAEKAKESV